MTTLETTGRVELALEIVQLTLVVGERSEQRLTIRNLTPIPDIFNLSVEGIPAGWCKFSRNNLNMLPNWAETLTLTIEIPKGAAATRYGGTVMMTASSQPAVRVRSNLMLQVLAPLKLTAYLRPRRVRGYKPGSHLIIRNRTVCNCIASVQQTNSNSFCVAKLAAAQLNVPAGQTASLDFNIQLQNKAPKDQLDQLQEFELEIHPAWQIGDHPDLVQGNTQLVIGEYVPQSRWAWFKKHPKLFILLGVLLLLVLLWSVLIVPLVRTGLLTLATSKIAYQGTAPNSLYVEQNSFNDTIQNNVNPMGAIVHVQVALTEPDQSVLISLKSLFPTATIRGKLNVTSTGDLTFVADDPKQLNTFPWFFLPPDQVVQKLNAKLKTWLTSQNLQMDKAEIEGNSLFLRLKVR